MAENKAEGPEGAGEDPIDGVDPAPTSQSGDAELTPEDGYTPPDADEADAVSAKFKSDKIASFSEPADDPTPSDQSAEPADEPAAGESDQAAESEDEPVVDEAEDTEDAEPDEAADAVTNKPGPAADSEADSAKALFHSDDDDSAGQVGETEEEVADEVANRPQRKQRPVKKTAQPKADEDTDDAADDTSARPATPVKKNRPTRTRAQATQSDAPKKTTPAAFTGQVVQELKKVSWPTGSQLLRYFLVVLGFVVFMIAFIGLLDLFFGWLMLKLFG